MKSSPVRADVFEDIDQLEARFDVEEPRVQAYLPEPGRFARLRAEAKSLSEQGRNSPLFGMLFAIKDIFHVDGFETHAGSRLPAQALAGSEARSVTRLKAAGALIAGKAVTTEFAYFSPGPTRNPHNPSHTPGGSSSGSAAAVAADLAHAALGTQTIGSVIRPASFCGVVGLKPTYERVDRAGVIPLSPSLDHVGLFTPDVARARLIAPSLYNDWDQNANADAEPVLGIPEGAYLDCAPESARAWLETIGRSLAEGGYEIHRVPLMADYTAVRARNDTIMSAEAARVHQRWFEEYEELYAPKTAELIRRGQAVSDDQLARAIDERATWQAGIDEAMIDAGVDLWITPSTLGAAPAGLASTGDPIMNLPWTQAGLPAMNIPAGVNADGMPLGLQVVGRRSRDEALLEWASGLEKALAAT